VIPELPMALLFQVGPWLALAILAVAAFVTALWARSLARAALDQSRRIASDPRVPHAQDPDPTNAVLRQQVRALQDEVWQLNTTVREITSYLSRLAATGPSTSSSAEHSPAPEEAIQTASEAPPRKTRPPRLAVEFDGALVKRSRALTTLGMLEVDGAEGAPARLYLNEDIPVDHIAFERWSRLYEFQGGKAYMRYRTLQPSLIDWDEQTGQGRPLQRGTAEVRS
jgi:hypothetical protein